MAIDRNRTLRDLLIAAVACSALSITQAADSPAASANPSARSQLAPPIHLQSSADLVTALEMLNRFAWAFHSGRTLPNMPDSPALKDLADWWFLTETDARRLDSLRTTAEAQERAGKTGELSDSLRQASKLIDLEATRVFILSTYARWQASTARQNTLLVPLLGRIPQDQQNALRSTLAASDKGIVTGIQHALADSDSGTDHLPTEIQTSVSAALKLYNDNRDALAGRVGLPDPAAAPSLKRDENTPCPPPAPRTSGRSTPGMLTAAPLEYPQEALQFSIEGTVIVKMLISATGCEMRGQVIRSSGVPQLDNAALIWAQRTSFLPAQSNGQPVDSETTIPINYKLRN